MVAIRRIPLASVVLMGLSSLSQAQPAPPKEVPAKMPPMAAVFDIDRSAKEDVVYFRNKDLLRGEVLNQTLTISTQYGQLTIPVRRCAGLSFEGARANTEAVVTVNFNRITGIVNDRVIHFKIGSSGETIPIRKEKVRFVLLQRTPEETGFLAKAGKSDLFFMANGDILTGEAAERKIVVRTEYAEVPVAFEEMKEVKMQGGENVTAVIAKANGDSMRGTLGTDEISLSLDIGVRMDKIYKDKFGAIYVDQATTQAPILFGFKQPLAGESEGILAGVGDLSGEKALILDLGNRVTMKLALIPSGKFLMGSRKDENGRSDDEGPQREVTISKPFYMGVFEVTQEQYEQVMGQNPSRFKDAAKPVEMVSWEDADKFCKKLSEKTGRPVALPTEAQWEYAGRAGSKTRFCFGDDEKQLTDYARYGQSGDAGTAAVGGRKPNAWGLHDIHGNVWEWCADWYTSSYANAQEKDPAGPAKGTYRVLRGGGWANTPLDCRSAIRYRYTPDYRIGDLGFRVAVDLK
jgi:formylglycine-generating enzyme required for sulfatase activity